MKLNSPQAYLSRANQSLKSLKSDDQLDLGLRPEQITKSFSVALEGFVAKNVSSAELAKLKSNPAVKSVEPDYLIALKKPTRPGGGGGGGSATQTTPWGITRIGGAGDGTGLTAWVVDSGIDMDHPDLNVDAARSVSFTGDNDPNDGNGHGTHVAGTIAAVNNSIGVVGVAAGANVVSLKVLGNDGSGDFSWTVQALDYIRSVGSAGDVVNMSLGPNSPFIHPATDQATLSLAQTGVKIAIAAGNNYDDADLYSPAHTNHPNIYTISAIAPGDFWTTFSNYGSSVDYAAPGYNVNSTSLSGGYAVLSGTSMASPHAAGILLLGNPNSDGQVKSAYWEYTRKGGGRLTGNVSENDIYSLSIFRYDVDGNNDPIMVR